MKRVIIPIIIGILIINLIGVINSLTIDSFSTNPDSIAPGKTSKISILLRNKGDYSVENVNAVLDLSSVPFAPYDYGTSYTINEIESDKSKSVGFEVIALNDAKSGIYKIPVHISYTENDVSKTTDSLISLMINSDPVLDVSTDDSLLLKDKQNKISLKIINKGLADVKFLEIEVKNSAYYSLISQPKNYVGDVDSNDFQTADYNLVFKQNIPSKVSIPITLTYQDITGKEYSKDFNLNVNVYSQQQAVQLGLASQSYTVYYVILIILLIILFVLYRIFRRRKKE